MSNLDPRNDRLDAQDARRAFPEDLRVEGVAPGEQDAVWALMDEWKSAELPAGFDESVMARIRAEEGAGTAQRERASNGMEAWLRGFGDWLAGLGAVRGFGLAGALAMIVLAAVMLRSPVAPPEDPGDTTAGQEFTAQQVEMALEDLKLLDELYSTPAPEDSQNNKI